MKVWKRNAVVAAIVLFVCVAVYLNWSYGQRDTSVSANQSTDTKTLGEAELVGTETETAAAADGTEEIEAVSEVQEAGYFDNARVSRQEARDEALAILQATVDDPNADEAAIASASESITAMAEATTTESEIENLVAAKGYEDCGQSVFSAGVPTALVLICLPARKPLQCRLLERGITGQ